MQSKQHEPTTGFVAYLIRATRFAFLFFPLRNIVQSPLSMANYKDKFSALLHVEEHQMNVDIRQFDMKKTTMSVYKANRRLLTLKVPGLAENRPSLLRGVSL